MFNKHINNVPETRSNAVRIEEKRNIRSRIIDTHRRVRCLLLAMILVFESCQPFYSAAEFTLSGSEIDDSMNEDIFASTQEDFEEPENLDELIVNENDEIIEQTEENGLIDFNDSLEEQGIDLFSVDTEGVFSPTIIDDMTLDEEEMIEIEEELTEQILLSASDDVGDNLQGADEPDNDYITIEVNGGTVVLEQETCTITAYEGDIISLDLPSQANGTEVLSIGDNVFQGCETLQSVILPEGMTSIGTSAFEGCNNLERVVLPSTITSVGNYAFSTASQSIAMYFYGDASLLENNLSALPYYQSGTVIYHLPGASGWTHPEWNGYTTRTFADEKDETISFFEVEGGKLLISLTDGEIFGYEGDPRKIEFPSEVGGVTITSIASYALQDAENLVEIAVPTGYTNILEGAFYECSSLRKALLPDGLHAIAPYVFFDCKHLMEVNLPASVDEIGDYAFYSCSELESQLHMPDSVSKIGQYAFYNCQSMTTAELSTGLKNIGDYALSGCTSISSLEVPEGVTQVGAYAFSDMNALEEASLWMLAPSSR